MPPTDKLSQTAIFLKHFRKYFRHYGGWRAVFCSPFFAFSIFCSFVSYGNWGNVKWVELTYQVIPNMLGFSLGTYALLFSLMGNSVKNALKSIRNNNNVLYIDELNATFLHFIFMQILAFFWAYLYSQSVISDVNGFLLHRFRCVWDFMPFLRVLGSAIGIAILTYAISLSVASSLAVYRIARISDPD